MHLLGFLLLPIVLTMGRHVDIRNIALKIENNILTEVRVTGKSPKDLDLSNLGLEAIEEGAFYHLSSLKTLNLSNNSIGRLPALVFSNLRNLEELNLADNVLQRGRFFDDLSSLRIVNISNNPMTLVYYEDFVGIPKSAKIFTRGIRLEMISSSIFERQPKLVAMSLRAGPPLVAYEDRETFNDPRVKVCFQDRQLKSLEEWKPHQFLTENCTEVPVIKGVIALNNLGIRSFQRGWYRLQEPAVRFLELMNNEIVTITKEMLNDLPEEIIAVSLRGNYIKRLNAGVMERASPLKVLDLTGNIISEIEDGALEKLNLTEALYLANNKLSNTKFVKSLPKISRLTLSGNNIEEIEKGSFKGMNQLYILDLTLNPLKKLENGALAGLPKNSKCHISRGNWGIEFIQPGLFDKV